MDTTPKTHEPAGGDGLLFIIAFAIVAVVTIEAAFIAFASWWLMSLVLLLVVLTAAGVATGLVRLMSDDTPVALPARKPAPEPEAPAARPARAPIGRAITHWIGSDDPGGRERLNAPEALGPRVR